MFHRRGPINHYCHFLRQGYGKMLVLRGVHVHHGDWILFNTNISYPSVKARAGAPLPCRRLDDYASPSALSAACTEARAFTRSLYAVKAGHLARLILRYGAQPSTVKR